MKNDSASVRLGKMLNSAINKKRDCILCDKVAINSHLLQKNGILSFIQSNGHIKQLKFNDIYKSEKGDGIIISDIGVKTAMTYKVFCEKHDDEIFKEIENTKIDITNYRTNLLLNYRTLCSEIIKKDIGIEYINKIQKSSYFALDIYLQKKVKSMLSETIKSKEQIIWYKNQLENEIFDKKDKQFIFKTFELKFIPICASAIYSPIFEPHIHKMIFKGKKRLDYIFINLIPQKEYLYLSLGYHKEQNNHWIEKYINSWEKVTNDKMSSKLTELFSTKIENWGINPEYFNNIEKKTIIDFKKYWNKNYNNLNINQEINFDLFKD